MAKKIKDSAQSTAVPCDPLSALGGCDLCSLAPAEQKRLVISEENLAEAQCRSRKVLPMKRGKDAQRALLSEAGAIAPN